MPLWPKRLQKPKPAIIYISFLSASDLFTDILPKLTQRPFGTLWDSTNPLRDSRTHTYIYIERERDRQRTTFSYSCSHSPTWKNPVQPSHNDSLWANKQVDLSESITLSFEKVQMV